MKEFDRLWKEINDGTTTVQEYVEFEYIFNLIKDCKSYLEVGTAEGKSLYVFSHALDANADITFIDLGEAHTKEPRDKLIEKLKPRNIKQIFGNSNDYSVQQQVQNKSFEVVFIDAGHEYYNVMNDAKAYGHLATKYLLFHDVTLPPVEAAFEEYVQNHCQGKTVYRIINSATYGYGVVEI